MALFAIGTIIAFDTHWTADFTLELLIFVIADLACIADIAIDAFLAIFNTGKALFRCGVEIVSLHA